MGEYAAFGSPFRDGSSGGQSAPARCGNALSGRDSRAPTAWGRIGDWWGSNAGDGVGFTPRRAAAGNGGVLRWVCFGGADSAMVGESEMKLRGGKSVRCPRGRRKKRPRTDAPKDAGATTGRQLRRGSVLGCASFLELASGTAASRGVFRTRVAGACGRGRSAGFSARSVQGRRRAFAAEPDGEEGDFFGNENLFVGDGGQDNGTDDSSIRRGNDSGAERGNGSTTPGAWRRIGNRCRPTPFVRPQRVWNLRGNENAVGNVRRLGAPMTETYFTSGPARAARAAWARRGRRCPPVGWVSPDRVRAWAWLRGR